MKKMKSFSCNWQNVSLLYFLFFATLVHLGYYAIRAETQSLVIFSLAFLFVYLIEKNMVIVLGISLVFTDLLYLIQRMPEGFTSEKECSIDDPSCNETFVANPNKKTLEKGNKPIKDMENEREKERKRIKEKERKNTKERKSMIDPMTNREGMNAVNPLVNAYETIGKDTDETESFGQDSLEGRELSLVQEDSKKMKSVLDKIKENPEIVDSIKTLNGIDIHELNKLINNLNSVVDSFNEMD